MNISPKEAARRKKFGEMIRKKWQTPEWRARLIEKQKRLGYRTY